MALLGFMPRKTLSDWGEFGGREWKNSGRVESLVRCICKKLENLVC